jgi:hypothetical protein
MPESVSINLRMTRGDDGHWHALEASSPGPDARSHVSRESYSLSRAGLMTEILKALLLVNGGGAAVALTLLKDVTVAQRDYYALAEPAVHGSIVMALGLLLAVLSAGARFTHSREAEKVEYGDRKACEKKQNRWRRTYLLLMALSGISFAIGIGIVALPTMLLLNDKSKTAASGGLAAAPALPAQFVCSSPAIK